MPDSPFKQLIDILGEIRDLLEEIRNAMVRR